MLISCVLLAALRKKNILNNENIKKLNIFTFMKKAEFPFCQNKR